MKKNKLILAVFFILSAGLLAVYFFYNNSSHQIKSEEDVSIQSNKLITREDPAKPEVNIIPDGSPAYEVEVAHSQISWSAGKIVGKPLTGTVGILSGSFWLDNSGNISGGKFIIDMEDITSTNLPSDQQKKLVDHLKSDDFFSVKVYPTAQFKITSVKKEGDDSYIITGDLTIKGQTHSVSFPANIKFFPSELIAQADFSIDRTMWGIKYGSDKFFKNLGDRAIKDKIFFSINLKAKKLSNN